MREFDATMELGEDIMIPKGIGGLDANQYKAKLGSKGIENIEYEILYKAGTRINPLDYMVFNESLVFIDGEDESQKEFAHKYQDKNGFAKIILVNGEPGFKEVEGKEYCYYYDQWGAYSNRFNIVYVPSVVYQKEGEKVLTIEEVKVE